MRGVNKTMEVMTLLIRFPIETKGEDKRDLDKNPGGTRIHMHENIV